MSCKEAWDDVCSPPKEPAKTSAQKKRDGRINEAWEKLECGEFLTNKLVRFKILCERICNDN